MLYPQQAAWALETGLPFAWVNADHDLLRWLPALASLILRYPDVAVMTHLVGLGRLDAAELAALMEPLGSQFAGSIAWRGSRFKAVWEEAERRGAQSFLMLHSRNNVLAPDEAAELITCPPERGVVDAEVQRTLRAWLDASPGVAPWRRRLSGLGSVARLCS